MKSSLRVYAALVPLAMSLVFAMIAVGQTDKPLATPPAATTKYVVPTHAVQDRGERLFNVNCFRCHQAPESLNPRITGTVMRHMRVRANLSAADERDILHFLNP